jgi:hypothetical protein
MLEKVDEGVEVLTDGKEYLVPTLVGPLGGKLGTTREYPVLGTRHYDVEFFENHMAHYHLDLRFVDYQKWQREWGRDVVVGAGRTVSGALPKLQLKAIKCQQSQVIINFIFGPKPDTMDKFRDHFRGQQCGGNREKGWICPHKGTFLGGQPVYKGALTCPAHGLKVNPRTGIVL